jgi:hypothetical protein
MITRPSVAAVLPPLFLVLAGCCAHDAAPPAVAPAAQSAPAAHVVGGAEPTSAEGCRACGGQWAIHGLIQEPSCLCPTSDAGKRCRDGGECQGQCLADEGEREVTEAGPPARGYFVGKCARFRSTFGCHRPIARGALAAGPIVLDEPPTQICAD